MNACYIVKCSNVYHLLHIISVKLVQNKRKHSKRKWMNRSDRLWRPRASLCCMFTWQLAAAGRGVGEGVVVCLFICVCCGVIFNMKGVFVMNTSLHDILFMTLDDELRRHYHRVAVKQELCQVPYDVCWLLWFWNMANSSSGNIRPKRTHIARWARDKIKIESFQEKSVKGLCEVFSCWWKLDAQIWLCQLLWGSFGGLGPL